jgi:hypothetical protein
MSGTYVVASAASPGSSDPEVSARPAITMENSAPGHQRDTGPQPAGHRRAANDGK